MRISTFAPLLFALTLFGCGGGDVNDAPAPKFLALSMNGGQIEVFTGTRSDYTITASGDSYLVTETGGAAAVRSVAKASRLRFADVTVTMDIDGAAGRVYRLYQAAFRRRPDIAGVGFWIGAIDRGTPAEDIAARFVQSSEFKTLHGQVITHHSVLLDSFYLNVLGRYGEATGMQFWLSVMASGAEPPVATVLLGFSDSDENKARVLPDIRDGISYLEHGVTYPRPLSSAPSSFRVQSDAGTSVMAGTSMELNAVNARFRLNAAGVYLDLEASGDRVFRLGLSTTNFSDRMRTENYATGATLSVGSLSCVSEAPFSLMRPKYLNGEIVYFEATADVPCGANDAKIHVQVAWNKFDVPTPAPAAAPAALWDAPPGTTPASGNYLYMQARPGHYFVPRGSVLLTPANSGLVTSTINELLEVSAEDNEYHWKVDFEGMTGLGKLAPGYYAGLRRRGFHNPARGGMSLSRYSTFGTACDAAEDWVMIDNIRYVRGHLQSVDLRFSLKCGVSGKLHWVSEQVSLTDGLWQPLPGATPASGSYVFLEGAERDSITRGHDSLSTRQNSVISASVADGKVTFKVDGNDHWLGEFEGFNNAKLLQPGYYEFPIDGKMRWGGNGVGCGAGGWFVVDRVRYDGAILKAIDLRFEYRCQPHAPAAHGKIHWDADEAAVSNGPAPVPAGLWTPPAAAIPALESYAYFEGEPGDYITGGGSFLVSPATSRYYFTATDGWFGLSMMSNDFSKVASWSVQVRTMDSLKRFQKGYYGNLLGVTSYNPYYGGLDIGGRGKGCNKATGWFVVDDVAYAGDTLMMLELRMEYHCEGAPPAAHAKVRWVRPAP